MPSLEAIADLIVDLHLVGGVVINGLLLYAIRPFSRPLMGTYKYLLAAFVSFDGFLSIAHAVTNPSVVIADTVFCVVTDPVLFGQNRRLTAAYCSFYAVSFTLMNIHFLYRFWSIRFPHLIELFSSKKFISQIAAILSGGFIVWYLVCVNVLSGGENEPGTARVRNEYARRYGKTLRDGWVLADFSEEDGQRMQAIASMIVFDCVMILSLTMAVTLATLTYKFIAKADKLSSQAVALQYKLLTTVCAQTFVPLVFVYIPYMAVNHLAFLGLPAYSIDRACMQLTACFPVWDAIIIIGLIKDYREGLISIIRPTAQIGQVETTWQTAEVSAIPLASI